MSPKPAEIKKKRPAVSEPASDFKVYRLKDKVRQVGKPLTVRADQIRANEYNYRSMSGFSLDKLKMNIRKVGFLDPITVRSGDENGPFEDGMFEIINGEHRWRAATDLGYEEIPVRDLGNVPTSLAKMLCVSLNELHGEANQDDLSKLVAELSKSGDPTLLELLPYDETELDAMRTQGDVDADALEKLASQGGESGGDEDEDDDSDDVAEFLGLYGLTGDQHSALVRRLEEEVVPLVKVSRKAGALLDRMITLLVKHVPAEAVEKKKKKSTDR